MNYRKKAKKILDIWTKSDYIPTSGVDEIGKRSEG